VERIRVAPDSRLIEIVMNLESGQRLEPDIVAQLRAVGITGSMFIELDRRQEGERDRAPELSFPSEHPIVSSKPSEVREFLSGIDDVIRHFQSLDLPILSDKLKLALDNLNQTIVDANVKGMSEGVTASLSKINALLEKERLDRLVASLEEAVRSLRGLLGDADEAVAGVENVVSRLERLIDDNEDGLQTTIDEFTRAATSANQMMASGTLLAQNADQRLATLQHRLAATGKDLHTAITNLNQLIEILGHQPSQVLFGDPPSPRRVRSDDDIR
jgi:phospholipid/cholesterol/gamma-HCH transport system substrate-binding protein